ncbi:MAG TPA: ABC transporter permease [Gammaproteobacteria bacterium]|jgi:ABC-type proline/glycine betaine transport system, permease component|nr:ABC transporter permease [Gammaproteobacteria bacterium]
MTWLTDFPSLSRGELRELRKSIDDSFRDFIEAYGENLEHFFDPLLTFLVGCEKILLATPWPVIIAVIACLAWIASRSRKIVAGVVISLFAIGYLGMWDDTMRTLSIITVCTLMAILIGIPLGILMARSDRIQSFLTPVLDVMQTMPSFVYLIPVVMLLGIGKIPGTIAVIIYALPPIVRLTNLGIRQVDKDIIEATNAFGCSPWQKLVNVQVPLALPSIFAGVNQTIMMSLSMVVIASMIGVTGLGQPVLKAITNQYFSLGLLNGLAIVAIAIIFDRVSQQYGIRIQKHREG